MYDYYNGSKVVQISRDGGYSKEKLISSENRSRAKEHMENPDIVIGNNKLKELFSEIGIVVNPEKMTNW